MEESGKILNGKYVIVRCKDAGVHAGLLMWREGRECYLQDGRRLWYFEPAKGKAWLSGVGKFGLSASSKVGCPVNTLLTENCEILECTEEASASIIAHPDHDG